MTARIFVSSLKISSVFIAVSFCLVALALGLTGHGKWYLPLADAAILTAGTYLGRFKFKSSEAIISPQIFMSALALQFAVPFFSYLAAPRGTTKLSLEFLMFLAPWSTILSAALLEPPLLISEFDQRKNGKNAFRILSITLILCVSLVVAFFVIQLVRSWNST